MKFSKEQQAAIDVRKGNYLISASAGSGKTAVLTERAYEIIAYGNINRFCLFNFVLKNSPDKQVIEQLLCLKNGDDENDLLQGVGIKDILTIVNSSPKTKVMVDEYIDKNKIELSDLLILTFTNAAAAEMRQRIRDKLIENGLHDVASSLDAVNIQTFDAFNSSIVKKYHYLIDLNKNFDVLDQSLEKIETRRILMQILDKQYKLKDKVFLDFVKTYLFKSDTKLVDFILSLYNVATLHIDKTLFLNSFVSTYCTKEFYDHIAKHIVKSFLLDIDKFKHMAKAKIVHIDAVDRILPYLDFLLNVKTYDDLYIVLNDANNKFPKRPNGFADADPEGSAIFGVIKDKIDQYRTKLVAKDEKDLHARFSSVEPYVELIVKLASELNDRLESFKKKHDVYSFNDIATFAYKIAKRKDESGEPLLKFKYIMIDEYQDTSNIQEEFISLIANNNVYVVGDVKQSIYRFRNANPSIFMEKYDNYGNKKGGERLIIPANYRSRKEVLEDINNLFKEIMTYANSGIAYTHGHEMLFGNTSFEENTAKDINNNYHLETYVFEPKKTLSLAEEEARIIASDILNKIENGYKIKCVVGQTQDKKPIHGLRNATYKDFGILIYSKKNFAIYQRVFNEYHIPLFANYKEKLHENDVTMVLENIVRLLYCVNNNCFDGNFLHSYISVLRSFLYHIDDQLIEEIGTSKNYGLSDLLSLLKDLSNECQNTTLTQMMLAIYDTFPFYEKLSTIGDASNNITLLSFYYDIAKTMDKMGYTLEDMVAYFDDLKTYDIESELESTTSGDDVVTLSSIHHSKGLQYKIVYYPELYKKFFNSKEKETFLADEEYGVSLPTMNYAERASLLRFAILSKEKREIIHDYERLFYVALSRAEEKMILLINQKSLDRDIADYSKISKPIDFFLYGQYNLNKKNAVVVAPKSYLPQASESEGPSIRSFKAMNDEKIQRKKASKDVDSSVNSDALLKGVRFHRYLELIDFNNKDTSFIKDFNDRCIIDRFLNNPLFKDANKARICHEYAFFDEMNNIHGIIDLMLVYDDHIDIIDFKLSKVDDDAYIKQVTIYKDYVSTISKLPIRTYVLGIVSGDIKEVS